MVCRAGCLGAGLRSSFSSTARAWASILLDRLKDKNTLLCATVVATLSTWLRHCTSLAELAEDFVAALDHKHPKVKLDSLNLLKVRGISQPWMHVVWYADTRRQAPETPAALPHTAAVSS